MSKDIITTDQKAQIAIIVNELNELLNASTPPSDEFDLQQWQNARVQRRAELSNKLHALESELNYIG